MSTTTPVKAFIEKCSLPISAKLQTVLLHHININSVQSESNITLNFRDTSYSADAGGFHPVEIALQKNEAECFSILYITDFCYMGNVYPELERSVDFDIGNNMAFFTGVGWQAIDTYGVHDFYQLWEGNFLSYLRMEAFDQIKVTTH